MSAPAGNKFWQNRTRHGREKIFASPELMWAAAEEYFEWCDNNPWYHNDAIKSGERAGEIIKIPIARPYTLSGLTLYLRTSESYFRSFKSTLKEEDKDFLTIISEIESVIYTQKFEGAAVGTFNANIIARDLGLRDRNETALTDPDGNALTVQIIQLPDNGRRTAETEKTDKTD